MTTHKLDRAGRSMWSRTLERSASPPTARSPRLAETVARCELVLEGIPADRALAIRKRLQRARTSLDCWNLRRALFDLIAQSLGDDEAQTRLAELQSWFESRRSR